MNILTINSPKIQQFDSMNDRHYDGRAINEACLVTVCAWCYPRSEQEKLMTWGLTLSHGICGDCKNNFLSGKPQTTIKL